VPHAITYHNGDRQDVHELLVFLLDLIERTSATPEARHINFDLFDRFARQQADIWEVMADLQWEERFRYRLAHPVGHY
jgi:uncharacterized UBP type Zn finger protein